jgi:hypothetical protein
MRRSELERKRLAMAGALLNARRLLLLSDNPLLDEAPVGRLAAERYQNAIMGRELALSDLVLEAGRRVLERMQGDQRLEREAIVLGIVLEGGSVRAAALRLGRSREHISNTAWRTVTLWVLEEFERHRWVSDRRGDRVAQHDIVSTGAAFGS